MNKLLKVALVTMAFLGGMLFLSKQTKKSSCCAHDHTTHVGLGHGHASLHMSDLLSGEKIL